MNDFDLQFEKLSPWIKARLVSRSVTVEGIEFPYVVVRHEGLGVRTPPLFVGLDQPSGVYFISDEVPGPYRELVLRHEMYELGIHKGQGVGRCELALLYELEYCPLERRPEYVQFRLEMLEALLAWINADPKGRVGYTDEQIREMAQARDRLKQLAKQTLF